MRPADLRILNCIGILSLLLVTRFVHFARIECSCMTRIARIPPLPCRATLSLSPQHGFAPLDHSDPSSVRCTYPIPYGDAV